MIKRIELENYRCYKSFEKDFTTGLNVIAGQNGTGKTTIVEAIAYALFGNKLTRGKANSWVRNNCKHGKVALYLNDYTIIRGDNEQYVEDSDGVIIARQHVGIDQWVDDTYGFSSELFSTSNYIAQKDIESFSFLQSAERIKRVETLLKIDILDKLKKTGKEQISHFKGDQVHLQSKVTDATITTEKYDIDDLCKKLDSLQQKLKSAESIYEDKLRTYIKYEDILIKWNRKKSFYLKIKDMKFKKFDYDLEKYYKIKSDLEHNEKIKKDLEELSLINSRNDTELVDSLREKFLEAKTLYRQLETVTETCPTCSQKVPNAEKLIRQRSKAFKDMQTYREKGVQAVERTRKFELKSQLIKYKYSLSDINQIITDYKLMPTLVQYEELSSIKEPKEINIDTERKTVATIKKDLDSLKLIKHSYDSALTILDTYKDIFDTSKNKLDNLKKFIKFIDQYRKEFSQNIIPLIQDNAQLVFNTLTEDKFNNFVIKKDYSIENYDDLSGSEADCASLAIRMAIAQVSRIGTFQSVILDEVAASFDVYKENLLLELLKTTSNQIIYISHGEIN